VARRGPAPAAPPPQGGDAEREFGASGEGDRARRVPE
jgi:hypothetical protein